MAGTEASHRVAEWLLDQYRSYGFDAEIVTYSAWLPQPREVKLELTKPSTQSARVARAVVRGRQGHATTSASSPHSTVTRRRET